MIVLEQATEAFTAVDVAVLRQRAGADEAVVQPLVIAFLMVMGKVFGDDVAQVVFTEDDELVEAFGFYRTNEPLRKSIQIRAFCGQNDGFDAFIAQNSVEFPGEKRVTIVNEEAFSRLDTIRMSRSGIQTPKPVAVRYSKLFAYGIGSVAAWCGRYKITPAVGNNARRSASRSGPICPGSLDGFHVNRITRTASSAETIFPFLACVGVREESMG